MRKKYFIAIFAASIIAAILSSYMTHVRGVGNLLSSEEQAMLKRIMYLNENGLSGRECSFDSSPDNLLAVGNNNPSQSLTSMIFKDCSLSASEILLNVRRFSDETVLEVACVTGRFVAERTMSRYYHEESGNFGCLISVRDRP